MTLDCGCPETYPDWHNKDVDLGAQQVHVLPIPMLLHMPLAHEAYRSRQQSAIEHLELQEPWPGFVLMRTGIFRGKLIRLLEHAVSPSRHVHRLPSPFNIHAVLHQGNISTAHKVIREMQMALVDAGRVPKELYLSYLTCGRCSEARGEKLLLLRRWVDSPMLKKRLQRQ